jgi:predicted aspartyl protease
MTFQREFVLDTGFSGDLKLDQQTAADLGIVAVQSDVPFINANGDRILVDLAHGFAEMDGRRAPIRILIGGGMPLAGSGLFSVFGYRVVVDYKNKTAHLERA